MIPTLPGTTQTDREALERIVEANKARNEAYVPPPHTEAEEIMLRKRLAEYTSEDPEDMLGPDWMNEIEEWLEDQEQEEVNMKFA